MNRLMAALSGAAVGAVMLPTYSPAPLSLPRLGVGAMAWGDPRRGWGTTFDSGDIGEAFDVLNDGQRGGAKLLFDTSEVAGYQRMRLCEGSEQLLGSLIGSSLSPPLVSTKLMPIPWANLLSGGGIRAGRAAVVEAVRHSLSRLGVASIDLYSVHAPLPYVGGRRALFEGLAEPLERMGSGWIASAYEILQAALSRSMAHVSLGA